MNGIPPVGISPSKRAHLKSRTGTRITIDYRILHQHAWFTEDYWAIDVAFEVDALSPVSRVGVVLINNYFTNGSFSGSGLYHQSLLSHTADRVRYIGSIDEPMKIKQDSAAGYFTITHAQIAVVLDGQWQEDPWQWPGCHNFNFDWMIGDVFR